MKTKMLIAAFLVLSAGMPVLSQQPEVKKGLVPVPAAKVAPVIPQDLKYEYFKAASQAANDTIVLEAAKKAAAESSTAVQTVVVKMSQVCGMDFLPSIDKDTKEPECAPRPVQTATQPAK